MLSAATRAFSTARPPVLDDILAPERNSFGAIGLAMAIAVLFSHSYLFHGGTRAADPLMAWTGHTIGEHAVQVFFFLSGILIAQSFDRSRRLVDFVAARVLRIFPALIVVLLLSALLLGPLVSTMSARAYFTDGEVAAYIVKTILMVTGSAPLPGVFETLPLEGRVNMSLWTLKYEVLCYLGVAVLGLAGLFNARWRVPATVLLAIGVAIVFIGEPKVQETHTFLDNLRYFTLYFLMGTLAYLARTWLQVRALVLVPLLLLFVALIGTRFAEFACAALVGYATIVAASLRWGFLTPFSREHDWSYGVYIYAAPIQQTLLQTVPGIDPLPLSCFALALTLPLAWASWVLIEKPAIGFRQSLVRWTARAPRGGAPVTTKPVMATLSRSSASSTRSARSPLRFGVSRASVQSASMVSEPQVGSRRGVEAGIATGCQRYEERLARMGLATRRLFRALRPLQPPS
jgi:peptidoglycan/LPS O-acetylase OafA/YrhL